MAEIGVKTARGVSPELLPPPPRGSYLLSEIVNDSGMTGATAKDVFDAGATPEGVSDAGGSAGTVATVAATPKGKAKPRAAAAAVVAPTSVAQEPDTVAAGEDAGNADAVGGNAES